jgi:hypothetical protein
MNVTDLRKVLGLPSGDEECSSDSSSPNNHRVRRQSMEQLDLIKVLFYFMILF